MYRLLSLVGVLLASVVFGQGLPEGSKLILLQQVQPSLGPVVKIVQELAKIKDDAESDKPEVVLSSEEQAMLDNLNKFRAQNGLPALVTTGPLMERARGHARWMASNHSMTHSAGIQENIAMGQRDAKAVTDVWIRSSGHNVNMRTRNKETGVAVATASNGTKFWVQQFATGSLAWKATVIPRVIARAATNTVGNVASNVGHRTRRFFGRRR